MVTIVTQTSTTAPKNTHLGAAKAARNDEFYTVWADIEREMNAYLEYDEDVFRDKVVLLPCDDPEWSNFTKFFALHFVDFGLKQLISTSYAPDSNPWNINYQPTLFESESPAFDANKTLTNGKKFTLEAKDISADGVINIDDLQWEYLEGDGDFRSPEVTAMRDGADFVITNPPFSLFQQFMIWVVGGGRKFSVIGNNNAITYNEVFPHIAANELWKGATGNSSDMVFGVPKGAKVSDADRLKAEKLGYPSDDERDYTRLGNSCWFTNIDHGRRHEPLQLMTTAENIKFSKHKEVRGIGYETYVNFDAIEVPFVDAIPRDHEGIMGVPITFLDKYDPDQFEIIANGDDRDEMEALGVAPLGPEYVGNTGRRKVGVPSTKKAAYKRILIRHKETPRGD